MNSRDDSRVGVALVTGATSGIGLAIATALARAGYRICFTGFGDPDFVQRIVLELTADRGAPLYIDADARRRDEIERLVEQVESRVGSIDVLVNNAGIQHVAPVDELPPEKWDELLAVNLTAAFDTIRLVVPGMRKRARGRIINIASVHGLVASANKSAYVAAKHGLIGLTRAVALELADTPITCNAVCPGWVETPLVRRQVEAKAVEGHVSIDQARQALVLEKQPSGRFVGADQVASLVVFLCSEEAGEVRGAAWTMDGGWTAQ